MKNNTFFSLFTTTLIISGYPVLEPTIVQNSPQSSQSVWQPFSSGEGGFTALFPGNPEIFQDMINTEQGRVELTGFRVVRPDEALYLIAYSNLPNGFNVSDNTEDVKSFFKGVIQGFMDEVEGEVISQSSISINNHPGRELKIQLPENTIARYRVYAINNRLYQLLVATPKEQHLQESIAGFFKSFQLTTLGVSVATLEGLNTQLNNELCSQNWSQAISILNLMITSLPNSESSRKELIDYRIRIQGIANSNTTPPRDLFSCANSN